jgi:hypothetical protein
MSIFRPARQENVHNWERVASDSEFWNQLVEEIGAFSRLLSDDGGGLVADGAA